MRECPKCGIEHTSGLVVCQKCGNAFEDTCLWIVGLLRSAYNALAVRGVLLVIGVLLVPERTRDAALLALEIIAGLVVAAFVSVFFARTCRRYWKLWLAFGVLLVAQWDYPFVVWWHLWNKPNSYYSHGPLVPLIALFMVGINHKRICLKKIQPSWMGLVLIAAAIPMFIFGRWTGSGNVCAITFMMFLIGTVLALLGTGMTRLLLFPMLYLLFMVPAPSTVLDRFTMPVQLWSTTLARHVLSTTGEIVAWDDDGWQVKQEGTIITSPRLPTSQGESIGQLRVAGECSGFRMLISLLTFTSFFVYMLRAPLWKKSALLLMSVPLSVFVNGLRIAVIGYVGIYTESAEAMMSFHNSWAMVFELVLSFAILFGVARLIKANDIGIGDPPIDPAMAAMADDTPKHKLVGRGFRGIAVILLFCLVIFANTAIRPLESTARGELNRANFPKTFGSWVSQDAPLDAITKEELKTADILQRVCFNTADDTQGASVFIQAARDTDAFHDPHSCLPGGGSSIDEDKVITLRFDKPKPMTVQASYIRCSNDQQDDDVLLIYWYNTENESYPRTSMVRLKMRQAQVRDLRGIAKSWIGLADGRKLEQELAGRQTYCYRFQTPANYESSPVALKRIESFIRDFVANSPQFK